MPNAFYASAGRSRLLAPECAHFVLWTLITHITTLVPTMGFEPIPVQILSLLRLPVALYVGKKAAYSPPVLFKCEMASFANSFVRPPQQ